MVFGCSVVGCHAPSGSEGATQSGGVAKGTPVARDQEPSMVGYDVRRLRPTEEPLVAGFERMRAATVKEGKRVAVLFSADWCEPCRDLESELGNLHPAGTIEDVRIIVLKEEEWQKAVRMDEFNGLRTQWDRVLNQYPLFVLLDDQGARVEEMQGGRERLEAAGIAATVPNWFASLRALGWQRPAG